jgi:hypothetical protein
MDQYSHFEIENLMQIEENQKCFDCGKHFEIYSINPFTYILYNKATTIPNGHL